jgi:hypothetical protein
MTREEAIAHMMKIGVFPPSRMTVIARAVRSVLKELYGR